MLVFFVINGLKVAHHTSYMTDIVCLSECWVLEFFCKYSVDITECLDNYCIFVEDSG